MEDPEFVRQREQWRERLAANDKSIYKAVNGVLHRPSVESELAQIDVPTLVLHGEEDQAIAPSEGRSLAEAIERAQFREIPHAGHISSIENPSAVNAAMREFYRKLG